MKKTIASSRQAVKRRATILDVARLAGVSQGSVSRVLTGKNWVSDELRAQVEQAAHQLGYLPNVSAQSLKSQRTRAIGALVSDMSNPLHGEFLLAAEERLQAAGYLLFVANTHDRPQLELKLLAEFRAGRIDGLLVAHSDESNRQTAAAMRDAGVPIVFHDREGAGLGDSVLVDHHAGACEATRYLIGLGHRRVALMSPPDTIWPGRARVAGYRRALSQAGIEFDPKLWRSLGASGEQAFSQAKQVLALERPPTAIICLGTRMLTGVLTALNSAGLQVPSDMSLIGVGDTDLVRMHAPAITALRWNVADCGRLAADLLLERLGNSGSAAGATQALHVPVELVVRYSCAPYASRHAAKRRTRRTRQGQ